MPRWLWFGPLAGLTLLLALGLYRIGGRMLHMTETEVIDLYAQRYLAEAGRDGAAETDCIARPGDSRAVWMVVRCGGRTGSPVIYPVDRAGRLVRPAADVEGLPRAPDT